MNFSDITDDFKEKIKRDMELSSRYLIKEDKTIEKIQTIPQEKPVEKIPEITPTEENIQKKEKNPPQIKFDLDTIFKYVLILVLCVGITIIYALSTGGYFSPILVDNSTCELSNFTIPECPTLPEIPACACSPVINVNFTLPKNITT